MKAPVKVPKLQAPSPSNVLPSEGQSFSGYWEFVTAMIAVLFVAYITTNGQLQSWLSLLIWSAPTSVVPTGAAPATTATTTAAASTGAASSPTTPSGAAATGTGTSPGTATTGNNFGGFFNSILGAFGMGSNPFSSPATPASPATGTTPAPTS